MPIGVIGLTKKITNKIRKNKKNIFLGGTYSGNPLTAFVGNETLNFIFKNKKKIFSKIEKQAKLLDKSINNFIFENNIDSKLIRFHSLIRIIFSKKISKIDLKEIFLRKTNLLKDKNF